MIQIAQYKIVSFRIYQIDFFLIYAVVAILMLNNPSALALALIAGIMQDSLSGSIMGINAISKLTVAYIIFLIIRWIDIRIKGIAILLFFLACLIDFAIIYLIGKWFNLFTIFLPFDKFFIKYTINSAVGYVFFILLKHLVDRGQTLIPDKNL